MKTIVYDGVSPYGLLEINGKTEDDFYLLVAKVKQNESWNWEDVLEEMNKLNWDFSWEYVGEVGIFRL